MPARHEARRFLVTSEYFMGWIDTVCKYSCFAEDALKH